VPHVNELAQKFGDRGLSVLGVTGESQGNTEPWVAKQEMRFAYAYDKTGTIMARLKSRGFPSAVLIDPEGQIAWKGHPASLKDATIEKVLKGAQTVPLFDVEGYDGDLRAALFEGRYRDLYRSIEKVADGPRPVLRARIDHLVDRRLKRLESSFDEGDYLSVEQRVAKLAKAFKRLPQEARIKALILRLKDREVVKVLRAQHKVADLVPEGERIAHKERAKIAKKLRKIIEDFPDTAAARDAERALDWIGM
jgi:AhpC/TSA family